MGKGQWERVNGKNVSGKMSMTNDFFLFPVTNDLSLFPLTNDFFPFFK
jgi:hypothetical protein